MTLLKHLKHTSLHRARFHLIIKYASFLIVSITTALQPELAQATDTPMGDTLCTVAGWMTGNTGRAMETLSVLTIGVMAFFNKISWGMAIVDAIGVAILFGAAEIVETMNAGAPSGCATS